MTIVNKNFENLLYIKSKRRRISTSTNWKKMKNYGFTQGEWEYKKGYDKNNVKTLRIDFSPGKEGPYKYEVYAIGKYADTTIDSYKTRALALTYVKNYMRKH